MIEKRALIIDDDYANRAIWELILTERGYSVTSVEDKESAMKKVSEQIPLYLVDYHLPDGHGSDVVAKIREGSTHSIVIMTSMDDDADVIRESISMGGNVFLVKPSSPLVMRQLVEEIETGAFNASMKQLINRNGRRNYSGV